MSILSWLACLAVLSVSIICIIFMKKIQPENFKLYLIYVCSIDILVFLFIGYLYFAYVALQ